VSLPQTTVIADLKDELADRLAALPGLAGVKIFSASVSDVPNREYIALIGEDLIEQEWAAIGKFSRDETITLTGAIYVQRPGKSEDVIREARRRAAELMGEIENVFTGTTGDPGLGGVIRNGHARPAELHEIAAGNGDRVALLRFEIKTGKIRLTRQ
jgi:hypothetical protein